MCDCRIQQFLTFLTLLDQQRRIDGLHVPSRRHHFLVASLVQERVPANLTYS